MRGDNRRRGLAPISIAIAEILDDLAKTSARSGQHSIGRLRPEDLGAQDLYMWLTELSDAEALQIEESQRCKSIIDALRCAIARGGDDV